MGKFQAPQPLQLCLKTAEGLRDKKISNAREPPMTSLKVIENWVVNSITLARNVTKSSDKELPLVGEDLFDVKLSMLAAHVSAICLSASALTPAPCIR